MRHDPIGKTRRIMENYRKTMAATGIQKVVELSSIGAQANVNSDKYSCMTC